MTYVTNSETIYNYIFLCSTILMTSSNWGEKAYVCYSELTWAFWDSHFVQCVITTYIYIIVPNYFLGLIKDLICSLVL